MKRYTLLPAVFALLLAAVLTGAAFAQQAPPGPTSPQAGGMIPDAISIEAFAAQSTARQQDPTLATPAKSAQTAQLAPSHFDDSIEAPQVAAAMRAMAAIHVPSMEAIRLAQASAKAAAEEKSQQARLQDPTLATPAQSAQTAQLAPSQDEEKAALMRDMVQAIRAARDAQTAQLAPSQYDSPGGLVTSAQATELGLPALASAKAASQVAILAEAESQMAILQATRPAQGSQSPQLASSHYAALGALTSAQARALGLPALAGIKEVAEERYLTAILQNPTLLALVQAEEASQSQHVGLTVGELASAESQHEATESPVEAAFEAAEAAHNPGVSMLAPSR